MQDVKGSYLIIFSQGSKSGQGHYTRSSIIEKYIKNNVKAQVKKVCIDDSELLKKDISKVIQRKIKREKIKILILDLNFFYLKPISKIKKMLIEINKKGILTIGIDSLRFFYKYLNYVWIPSPYKEKNILSKNVIYGWDKMIFNRYKFTYKRSKKILFLLGSSKNIKVSKSLPPIIEKKIPDDFEIHWVLGKFSKKPKNINASRWIFHKDLNSLSYLLKETGFVFSMYGLSLFESVSCRIPTVSYCTNRNYKKDYREIAFFKKKRICLIETDLNKAITKLCELIKSKKKSVNLTNRANFFFSNPDYSFIKKIH